MRVGLLLILGIVGLLAGVMALVAIAASGIAIERAVTTYRVQRERDELQTEADRLHPLAQICEIQTTTAQLLLGATKDGQQPKLHPSTEGSGSVPKLPTIDDIQDGLGVLGSTEESRS